jgi:3'-5' exoribonuclease
LQQAIESMEDADYRALLHAVFDDAETLEAFRRAPAARNNHHAYVGGLLEHTVSILQAADRYVGLGAGLRRDLLIAGVLLHDIGKIHELRAGVSIEYTDEGSLLGHLTMGVILIEDRLRGIPDFPREKRNLIYHLILSHHGRYEYGSPVLPAIPEAFALHHLDNLDAKVFAAQKAIREDTHVETNWTDRSWMLETRLYKG